MATTCIKRYSGASGDVTESCNNSSWTLFYDIDYSPNRVFFEEIMIKTGNSHKIKVMLDDLEVIAAPLSTLQDVLVTNCGSIMSCIKMSVVNNVGSLVLNLCGTEGESLKIYQQHKTGTGNLTLKGYVLTRLEET